MAIQFIPGLGQQAWPNAAQGLQRGIQQGMQIYSMKLQKEEQQATSEYRNSVLEIDRFNATTQAAQKMPVGQRAVLYQKRAENTKNPWSKELLNFMAKSDEQTGKALTTITTKLRKSLAQQDFESGSQYMDELGGIIGWDSETYQGYENMTKKRRDLAGNKVLAEIGYLMNFKGDEPGGMAGENQPLSVDDKLMQKIRVLKDNFPDKFLELQETMGKGKKATDIVSWVTPEGDPINLPKGTMPPAGSTKAPSRSIRESVGDTIDDAMIDFIADFKYRTGRDPNPTEMKELRLEAANTVKRQSVEKVAEKVAARKGIEISAKRLSTLRDKADGSLKSLEVIAKGKQLVDAGIYSGSAANIKRSLDKWLQEVDIFVGGQRATNTDTFASLMGKQVGQVIKDFGAGTGLSDADREYAEKIAGGKITLTGGAIKKLLDINEKLSIWDITYYNKAAKEFKSKEFITEIELPQQATGSQSPSAIGQKTTITMPDGSIQVFDESGKRIQ